MTASQFELLYQGIFLAAAVALLVVERLAFARRAPAPAARRWVSNLGLWLIGGVIAGLVLPAGIFAFAASRAPGPVSALGLPLVAEVVLTFLLLDLWRYWEHRIFHRIALLWRFHLVHHSDTAIDVTTTQRHHPVEVLMATTIAMVAIVVLGLPVIGLALYLVTAGVIALWSHANVRLPAGIDRVLRWFVVTPSVHALHHSSQRAQTDSNFGMVLTAWDRLFGTYADPERSQLRHYGLDYFHRAEDTRLGRVLLQPFRYRAGMAYPKREDERRPLPGEKALLRRGAWSPASVALAGAIAGSLLVSLAMAPTWAQLFRLWQQDAYQYAWLVVPTVVYLIAIRRGGLQAAVEPRPDFSGAAVVILAAVAWCAGALMSIDLAGQLALVLALQGVAMCALGFAAFRVAMPVLAMLFLLVPSGDLLLSALMKATATSMQAFPILAGLPYSMDGFVIVIDGKRYIVAEACSGLVMVNLAVFLSYSIGLLLYRSWWRVVALAAFSALLAFMCNAVRVNAITVIDYLRGTQMDLAAHTPLQWMALALMLAGVFYVLHRLSGERAQVPDTQVAAAPARGLRRFAPAIAGGAASLLIASTLAWSQQDPKLPRASLTAPPALAGWTRVAPEADEPTNAENGTRVVRATYARGERRIDAVVVEAIAARAKLAESALAPADLQNWHKRGTHAQTVCANGRCIDLVHASWVREHDRDRSHHAYYVYTTGDFESGSRLAVRVMQGWHRLTRTPATSRLIGIAADAGLEPREAAAALAQLAALDVPGVRAAAR